MQPMNSLLFVPGHRPERFEKALAAGADAVIIDLEDAVAPQEKETTRAMLAAWLSADRQVLVRINAARTPWFDGDLALLKNPGIAGVVLPKAERVDDVAALMAAGASAVLPLIESAAGFANCRGIAACPGVSRLIFGTIDFQADLGMRCTEAELLPYRVEFTLASRLANIAAPIDGVCTAIDDETLLTQDTLRARRLGFGGKLCIHPKQVGVVNRGFTPEAEEIDWARRVIAADAASAGAAVAVDGKMVDRPVVLRALNVLREAEARLS